MVAQIIIEKFSNLKKIDPVIAICVKIINNRAYGALAFSQYPSNSSNCVSKISNTGVLLIYSEISFYSRTLRRTLYIICIVLNTKGKCNILSSMQNVNFDDWAGGA